MSFRACMLHSLKSYSLGLSDSEVDRLVLFVAELMKWNRAYNLTSISEEEAIAEKHVLDSLTLLGFVPERGRLLDVGSGAGFPAIPLAICRPELGVTSIDSAGKKIRFQNHVVRTLSLENLIPFHGRVESLIEEAGNGNTFDCICSRAFSSLALFIELTRGLLKPGGTLLAMRGPDGEEDYLRCKDLVENSGFELDRIQRLELPLSGSRRVILSFRYLGESAIKLQDSGQL